MWVIPQFGILIDLIQKEGKAKAAIDKEVAVTRMSQNGRMLSYFYGLDNVYVQTCTGIGLIFCLDPSRPLSGFV